jgi:hypothetical protein
MSISVEKELSNNGLRPTENISLRKNQKFMEH